MLKFFLGIVIILLTCGASLAGEGKISKPIIRGDGNLVDKEGFIVGIRNQDDPLDNDDNFYFYGVDKEGNMTDYILYRVYRNEVTGQLEKERLVEEVKDYSQVLAESSNAKNVIIIYDDKVFFNGAEIKSGDVASGGIVVYFGGELYYNGAQIETGTQVFNGKIITE
jgi:hypothetical protein